MHGMRINIQNLRLKQLMKSNIIKSTTVKTPIDMHPESIM